MGILKGGGGTEGTSEEDPIGRQASPSSLSAVVWVADGMGWLT